MSVEERWVNVEDAAAHLGVAKDSIYRWIEEKELPAHRVGRLLRFKLSEIDEWVRRDSRQQRRANTARKRTSYKANGNQISKKRNRSNKKTRNG